MPKSTKSNKPSQSKPDDIEKIQNDVASFASSLGLASSLPSSGFNDVDFRPKKKPPQQKNKKQNNVNKKPQNEKPISENPQKQKPRKDFVQNQKPRNILDNNQKPRKDFAQNEKPRNILAQNEKPRNILSQNEEQSAKDTNLSKIDDDDEVEVQSYKPTYEKYRNMAKLPLVKASVLGMWHEDESELEGRVIGGKRMEIGNGSEWKVLVEKKKELGERLMAQYTFDYESSRGQTSDIKMLATTQRSGTAADKVSAYSVLIGDNPIANLRSLDALLAMVTSKVGKRHALTGFEALKELFLQSLLPDRKLKTLFQRPLNHLPETKDGYSLLLFWYWEECLKTRYERFVSALEEASRDVLRILKDKALKIMYALLSSKSEQERKILTALVNKLGDPDNKAASNADYYLTNLLSDHPNMKVVVIDEVDAFLFRPHLGMRAKYHAVNFLTQIRLSHHGDGPKVAKRLVEVYFALFKVLVSGAENGTKDNKGKEIKKYFKKDEKAQGSSETHVEMDSRLLSALLTGVNRAFPFVSGDAADEILDVQTPMLFKLVHSQNFNVGIQALMLIDKISSKNQVVSDRFYRSLYAKLLQPAALNTSKAEMFIGLLLRAMKNDVNLKRVSAFSKRLLQVALQQPAQYACGCLFLLSEVFKARPPLWNTAFQSETVDDDIEHFEDVPDEAEDDEPSTDGKVPQSNDGGASNNNASESESEDEEAPSAPSSEDDGSDEEDLFRGGNVEKPLGSNATLSDHDRIKPHESSTKHSLPGGYDPRHREPSFCNADHTSWWELTVLASHAHPSVSTMARTLLSGANIVYNGNPLDDLSLTAFLDKFMEKKPKQSTWHGGSQIEPAKKLDMNKHLIGPEIVSLAEDDVSPEDLVFHKFYMNKMSTSAKPKKKKKKTAEELDAEELYGGDESDNEEIDNLLDATEPSIEAEGDYDYDDLDNVADEDDDDLIGDVSDNEMDMDMPSDSGEGDDDAISDDDDINVGDADDLSDDDILGGADDFSSDDDINIGDEDDALDDDEPVPKKGKKKSKKSSASPFASAEDYEHLLNEDIDSGEDDVADAQKDKKKRQKKRKHAQTDDNEKTESAEKSGKRKKKKGKTQH